MKKRDLLELRIHDYLSEANIMQLSTVADSKPWVCNVWFAADDKMNIYWFSSTTRRHSKEVENNPNVAAAMCIPKIPAETDKGGLQVEGTAEIVTNPLEVAKATKLYLAKKLFTAKQIKDFMKHLKRPHRFYRIKPSKIVLFDPVNYPDEPLQELDLVISPTL